MKTIIIFIVIFAAIIVWFLISKSPETDIVARNGIHWHPHLTVNILGENQKIPANIGMIPSEVPIHTHEEDGIIHLEFSGLVKKADIKLGNFFEIWGKTFNKDCIFDKCSDLDGTLKMLVNGKENTKFENYIMQDEDEIEIIFGAKDSSQAREIIVSGSEFSFNPKIIELKAGEKVKLTFRNNGSAPHNLVIEGLGISTKTIGMDEIDIIEFTVPASGSYNIFCSVPGHRSAGMEGKLFVE